MGKTEPTGGLPHAAGRRAAGRVPARFSLKRFLRDERGTTAIEYGLILCLIFLAIIVAVSSFGSATTDKFNLIANKVTTAGGS